MSNHQPDNRNSFWLLAWGFLAVQITVFLFVLKRLFERSRNAAQVAPHPVQVDVRLPEPPNAPESGKINWDVIGITSAAVTLISAAIFYFAGRVYETHWYGYYGINVSIVNLPAEQVMVQGIPGIVFFGMAILASLVIVGFVRARRDSSITVHDIPIVVILAYGIANVFMYFLLIAILPKAESETPLFEGKFPYELAVAFLSSMVVVTGALVLYLLIQLDKFAERRLLRGNTSSWRPDLIPTPEALQRSYARLTRLGPLGLGISVFLLFFLSAAVSVFMGEYDARHGIRTLDGAWRIQETFVYSDEEVQSLPKSLVNLGNNGFKYGPLGLVARDDTTLFLVDWDGWQKDLGFFRHRPNLYVVPLNSIQNAQLYMPSPPTPTPTRLPTPRPTVTPSP